MHQKRSSDQMVRLAPAPPSDQYPFLYVGHGEWNNTSILIVLREPLDSELTSHLPAPFDSVVAPTGQYTIQLKSRRSSKPLQVMAEAYSHAKRQETHALELYDAFNATLDTFLVWLHEQVPIAVVIRPKGRYDVEFSAWHDWSCEWLPEYWAFLSDVLRNKKPFLAEACWRWWLRTQWLPFPAQQEAIDRLSDDVRPILSRLGISPEADHYCSLSPYGAQMIDLFRKMPSDVDIWDEFESIGNTMGGDERDWSPHLLRNQLDEEHTVDNDLLLVELCERALRSPSCGKRNYWLPSLAGAYIRLGRLGDVLPLLAPMLTECDGWDPIVAYFEALGRPSDADAMYMIAAKSWSVFDSLMRRAGSNRPFNNMMRQLRRRSSAAVFKPAISLRQRGTSIVAELLTNLIENSGSGEGEAVREVEIWILEGMVEVGALDDSILPVISLVKAKKRLIMPEAE